MYDQFTYNLDIPPESKTNTDTSANTDAKKSKIKLTIILTSIIVLLIAIGIIAGIVIAQQTTLASVEDIDPGQIIYTRDENYTELLNLLANIHNGMTETELYDMLELGKINKNYVHIDTNTKIGYIASTKIDLTADYTKEKIEYITFEYDVPKEDYELSYIEGITYHGCHDGACDYIQETSDGEFLHLIGSSESTNSFETLSDAIYDYLGRMP